MPQFWQELYGYAVQLYHFQLSIVLSDNVVSQRPRVLSYQEKIFIFNSNIFCHQNNLFQ